MKRLIVAMFGLLLMVGCAKSPEQQIVGKWVIDPASTAKLPPAVQGMLKGAAIEFKPDKTVSVTSGSKVVPGTYTMKEHTATMTMGQVDGQSVPPRDVVLSDDGSKLTIAGASADDSVSFKKQ